MLNAFLGESRSDVLLDDSLQWSKKLSHMSCDGFCGIDQSARFAPG